VLWPAWWAAQDSQCRKVLAPLYLQELVYRFLQRDRLAKLILFAGQQADGNPVAAALHYIDVHVAEPLTVATVTRLAHHPRAR
jgi:hypothetical protein